MWSVRYYDATGSCRRLRCGSREEADVERARRVFAESLGQAALVPAAAAEPARGPTLAEFWPVYRGDAEGRLARSTLREYERLWDRRLEPRFGQMTLDAIRPRMVSQWRAQLLRDGVGAEAVRDAMVLLQAMFTLAIEWGETDATKPAAGRSAPPPALPLLSGMDRSSQRAAAAFPRMRERPGLRSRVGGRSQLVRSGRL